MGDALWPIMLAVHCDWTFADCGLDSENLRRSVGVQPGVLIYGLVLGTISFAEEGVAPW